MILQKIVLPKRAHPSCLFVVAMTLFTLIHLALIVNWTEFDLHQKNGDAMTTMRVHFAGMRFNELGFLHESFKPYFPAPYDSYTEGYYTHFPPLPYLAGGVVQKLGFLSLRATKILFIGAAICIFWIFILLIKELFGIHVALLTALLYILSSSATSVTPFVPMNFADLFCLAGAYFFLLSLKAATPQRSRMFFWLAGAAVFLNAYSSFEMIFAGHILLLVIELCHAGRLKFPSQTFKLGFFTIASLITHFLTNISALGSYERAVKDLKEAFLHRSIQNQDYIRQRVSGLRGYFSWMDQRLWRSNGLSLAWGALTLMGLGFLFRKDKKPFFLLVAFLAASLSFALLFVQHTLVHFPIINVRHFLYSLPLILAVALSQIPKLKPRGLRWVWGALIAAQCFAVIKVFDREIIKKSPQTYDLALVREALPLAPSDSILFSTDTPLVQASFHYQPRKYFELDPTEYVRIDPARIHESFRRFCGQRNCYLSKDAPPEIMDSFVLTEGVGAYFLIRGEK